MRYRNGYYTNDLSADIPTVHYEKRSRIPSAYSYDDVMKLLSLVDRNNPVGKRNYAVLMLLTRLGIRCGDICRLQFENALLLEQLKKHREQIYVYGKLLAEKYPADICTMFTEQINKDAQAAHSREIYNKVCSRISYFAESGYTAEAITMINTLRRFMICRYIKSRLI